MKVMTSSTPTISLDLHNNNNDSTSLNSSIPNMRAGEEVVSSSYIPVPSFWRLLRLNLPKWKETGIGCLSAVLSGVVQLAYAFAMGSIISVYFLSDHEEMQEQTKTYYLCFVALSVFSLLVNLNQHYNFAVMRENLTKRERDGVFKDTEF